MFRRIATLTARLIAAEAAAFVTGSAVVALVAVAGGPAIVAALIGLTVKLETFLGVLRATRAA